MRSDVSRTEVDLRNMCVEGEAGEVVEAGEVMCNVKDFGLSRVFLKRPDARKWYRVLLEEVRVH